jgi:hypothetical protein
MIALLYFGSIIVLVDAEFHFKHFQVIRCNIKTESVEKCRDVENETISEKLQRVSPWATHLNHRFILLPVKKVF